MPDRTDQPEFKKTQPGYAIQPYDISEDLKAGRYLQLDRSGAQPLLQSFGTQAVPVAIPGLYAALIDQIVGWYLSGGVGNEYIEMYQTSAQTLPPRRHDSKGYLVSGDLVDNEAVEYVFGGNATQNPLAYTAPVSGQINPDVGRFIRITFELADTSGSDQMIMGFRKVQSYAVPTSILAGGAGIYTDFFGIGFSGTAAANLVKVISALNGSVTAVADTTFAWADGLVHTLEVRIIGRRAFYYINGASVGSRITKDGLGNAITAQNTITPPAYLIDVSDVMVPFFFHRHDAAAPGAVYWRKVVTGTLRAAGLDPNNREL